MAAHDVYANELTSLGHGYPLWEADSNVSISDVGYLRFGQLIRLFNASLPKGDECNEFGEPDGYEPLHIGEIQDRRAPHPPGAMFSRSISKKSADVEVSGSILEAGAGFEFSCAKNQGAVLIIHCEAPRKDALRLAAFKEYMLKNYKSWLRFANNEHNARGISLSDLVFVTGCDNTADWASATFSAKTISGAWVVFSSRLSNDGGCRFLSMGRLETSQECSYGKYLKFSAINSYCFPVVVNRSVFSHCGPRIPRHVPASANGGVGPLSAADLDKFDQCIFLRGFKVLSRKVQAKRKFGLKIPGSSGGLEELSEPLFRRTSSQSDTSSPHTRSSTGGSSWGTQRVDNSSLDDLVTNDVEVVSNEPQRRAPLDALLEYILENSEATVAVAHDNDLAAIVKDNDSLDFDALVRNAAPHVIVDSEGVGTVVITDLPNMPIPDVQPTSKTILSQSPEGSGLSSPTIGPGDTPRPAIEDMWEKQKLKRIPPEAAETKETQPLRTFSGKQHRNPKAAGQPDSAAYNAEQEHIKAEIDALQVRLDMVQDRISLTSRTGRVADRRNALRAELDSLRDQQLASKTSLGTASAEIKTLQEETRKKIKDLQAMSKKLTARTTDELDEQIRVLERRVDAGVMSAPAEKKILSQISGLRRSRAAVENYQSLQAAVDTNRAKTDALRKQVSAGSGAISERMNAVRAELESFRKESELAFADRGRLYDERNSLQTQLSQLHEQKRQSVERFREARESYWLKVNEEREKQAERAREERAALEEQRRIEARGRLLEKARIPAFAAEIHDCRSLLEYFSGGKAEYSPAPGASSVEVAEQSKHQPRQSVENHPGAGWVPLKKKSEDDSYFVGGKGKAKKPRRKGSASTSMNSTKIGIPLGILSTLLSLSITPPAVNADVPRTIEELHRKIEWFEANQARATEENIARTEADLYRIAHPARSQVVT